MATVLLTATQKTAFGLSSRGSVSQVSSRFLAGICGHFSRGGELHGCHTDHNFTTPGWPRNECQRVPGFRIFECVCNLHQPFDIISF